MQFESIAVVKVLLSVVAVAVNDAAQINVNAIKADLWPETSGLGTRVISSLFCQGLGLGLRPFGQGLGLGLESQWSRSWSWSWSREKGLGLVKRDLSETSDIKSSKIWHKIKQDLA